MTHSFKIGDRVRLNALGGNDPFWFRFYGPAKTGTITEIKDNPTHGTIYRVRQDYSASEQYLSPYNFKPRKAPKTTPSAQTQLILDPLTRGLTITRIEAMALYRVGSLSRRICDLKDRGHKIVSTMKTDPTGRAYAEYSLRKGGRV
jgi:hypothetical protein